MENWIIVGGIIILLIISVVVYLFIFNKKNEVEDESLMSFQESTTDYKDDSYLIKDVKKEIVEPDSLVKNEEKEPQLNISISSKTEKEILRKLDLFEKNRSFLKKDVTLNSLSKQFQTNTKYLSEIIKIHRNKQFNNYLNELRVDYIVNRLLTEPQYINTKVAYLASDSGFASHSTFTTIFTQIMNESPSIYIKKLKEERKSK